MPRVRETKLTLPCSQSQKKEVEQRAEREGLSITNYLRSLLGWPMEQQGNRKDLMTASPDSSGAPGNVGDGNKGPS